MGLYPDHALSPSLGIPGKDFTPQSRAQSLFNFLTESHQVVKASLKFCLSVSFSYLAGMTGARLQAQTQPGARRSLYNPGLGTVSKAHWFHSLSKLFSEEAEAHSTPSTPALYPHGRLSLLTTLCHWYGQWLVIASGHTSLLLWSCPR